ncbi:MAG: energy transducer TonB [Terracidiphilus sp.]
MRNIVPRTLYLTLIVAMSHAHAPAQQDIPASAAPTVDVNTMTPPKALNNVEAEFPPEARAKRINGRCLISLIVDVTGMPQNLRVVRCNDQAFEKNSLDAVTKYRFKPATRKDGTTIAVQISVEINYRRDDAKDPETLIRYGLFSPPGTTSDSPGTDGVYPLTKSVTPPAITKFSDEGYGNAAFPFPGNVACVAVLTISTKGKPSDPSITQCDKSILEKPAIASLLKSHYSPGTFNGAAVPVRMSVRLEFDGFYPTK